MFVCNIGSGNDTFNIINYCTIAPLAVFLIGNKVRFKLDVNAPYRLGSQYPRPSVWRIRNRNCSRIEIVIALFKSGIELNPGPDINNFEIISINCNGLTSDMRLMQAIGKIKKRIKSGQAIIFLQETHNTNIALLESIWNGPINISMGTGGSRGVITLCTPEAITLDFKADSDGRYLFTATKIGDSKYLYTANLYSPNEHNASKTFFSNTINDWESFCCEHSSTLSFNHLRRT